MRKIICCSIYAALMAWPLFHCTNVTAQDQPTQIVIEMQTEDYSEGEKEERSIKYIAAYYLPQTSTVEVVSFGVGTSIATLKNSFGCIVAQTVIDSVDGKGTLIVPDTYGIYQITIDSSRYYSYGFFTKM